MQANSLNSDRDPVAPFAPSLPQSIPDMTRTPTVHSKVACVGGNVSEQSGGESLVETSDSVRCKDLARAIDEAVVLLDSSILVLQLRLE